MPNRSSQQQRSTAGQRATPSRTAGGLRLFGQHTPGAPAPPGAGQFGRFADTWMSRLLIGGAVLLLAIMFPLQWLRTPELVVRANLNTFSPHPGAAAATGADAATGAVTASYDLSEDATISASVYDSAGAVVRTLLAEQKESAGPHFVQWDGATDSGGVAVDGAYRLAITARGPARSTSGSVTIAVDSTPPAVKLVNLPDGEKLKSADLLVQGVTEPGAVVQFAGSQDTVTADGGGGFTLHRQLVHGANSFTLLVHDASGNTTSVNRTVDLLDRPPVVRDRQPRRGQLHEPETGHRVRHRRPGHHGARERPGRAAGPRRRLPRRRRARRGRQRAHRRRDRRRREQRPG